MRVEAYVAVNKQKHNQMVTPAHTVRSLSDLQEGHAAGTHATSLLLPDYID